MNKVYVVTAGAYSDYHIIGVMADAAKAQEYCDRYNAGGGYSDAGVEEFELDTITNRKYLYSTTIYHNFQDTPQESTSYQETEDYHENYEFKSEIYKSHSGKPAVVAYAETVELSQKIARDLWAQAQAEEAGI